MDGKAGMDPYKPFLQNHFRGHKSAVTSMSFHPTKKTFASSSEDSSIILWNSAALNSLKFIARNLPVNFVHFSPQGDVMAAAQGPYVRMWVPHVHGKASEFKAHVSIVRSVEFSPDGFSLMTASDDKTIKIWNTVKRKFISSLVGHTNWVRYARYSSDGHTIISCSDDKTMKLWDVRSGKVIHTYEEQRGLPKFVEFHPFAPCFGAALSHNIVKIFDTRSHKILQYYGCHSHEVNKIAFHPMGHFLLTASEDATIKVIDIGDCKPLLSIEAHKSGVTALAFSKTGNHFATGSADKQVLLWKTNFDEKSPDVPRVQMKESLAYDVDYSQVQKMVVPIMDENVNPEDFIKEVYSPEEYDEDRVSIKMSYPKPIAATSKIQSHYRSRETVSEMEAQIESLTIENAILKRKVHEMEIGMAKLNEIFSQMKGISKNLPNDTESLTST